MAPRHGLPANLSHHAHAPQVRLPLSSLPCTYKYGIRRGDGSLELEAGENRMVALPVGVLGNTAPCLPASQRSWLSCNGRAWGATTCSSDGLDTHLGWHNSATLLPNCALPLLQTNDGARAPALVARFDGCFRRQQRWRGAGVAVPVFSLRRCAAGCVSQPARHVAGVCTACTATHSTANRLQTRSNAMPGSSETHASCVSSPTATAAVRAWGQESSWTSCPWWTCAQPPGSASYRWGAVLRLLRLLRLLRCAA